VFYPSRRSNNCKYLCPKLGSTQIIVGDFNTPLTAMERSSKQKINKEIMTWNDTLDQMDLTYIFRTFHPKAAEYTFF